MPQMGESIAEGTIVRWIKKVGDNVDRDEPLFEISTDKVDAEIPSPAAGVLMNIAVQEGETVPVNSVVATIGDGTSAVAPQKAKTPPAPSPQADGTPMAKSDSAAQAAQRAEGRRAEARPATQEAAAPVEPVKPEPAEPAEPVDSDRHALRQRSSPLVRRIAKDHGVDVGQIAGTGLGGRVTKSDILAFIDNPRTPAATKTDAQPDIRTLAPSAPITARAQSSGHVAVEPMSIMRKKIAEHMVLSKRTSAHVYSVFEVNYQRVDQIRKAKKEEYERAGVKLTFTSFIAKVVVDCLRRHRTINASIDGDNILYKGDINLGVAVALENGLIVPVVKQAGEKNLLGLSRAIQDVADRARAKKLNPEEVHDGTFTITNPGGFGAQFGLPIINQPQVAILGVGTIEKRAVVIDDMIGIRLMGYLTLGYDHRLVDGAVADQFMADVKKGIEEFDGE
jgi:pyruvate dehydrogenase E2 component (dihydrolipoyllysine-residue acetyltransferase)